MNKTEPSEYDDLLMLLCHELTRVARAYKTAGDRVATQYGFSQATAWPAALIYQIGDGVRPGEIANALGLDPSSVVRVIDQLIAAGIMTRKEDESDRRAKLLSLTESGRERIEVLLAAMRPFRAGLFKNINPAELEVSLKVLRELGESIRRNG
ncbi:MAG: MarR family transcriptional regulator [Oxalobacter sp.]|nr:MarR family transcriptional regulator [Oxalobacter sp.]